MNITWIKKQLFVFLRGAAIGSANVIPGVSGGTIALITGVFERLINALKSFDLSSIKMLLKGDFRGFSRHVDLIFLVSLFCGIGVAIISFARILDFMFRDYPVYCWAFFLGLVFASIFFVGKTIERWHPGSILLFIAGTVVAVYVSVAAPGTENDSFWYLMLCGVVAICCMLLPGLSGSFVLILMGNYHLVMVDAVNNLRFDVLIPIAVGVVAGLIAFSHVLSWLLKRFHDSTIATLTGFILGSIGILWPWKTSVIEIFGEKEKVIGYAWHLPQMNAEFVVALICCVSGILIIYATEILAKKRS